MAMEELCSQVAADGVKISKEFRWGLELESPEEAGKCKLSRTPPHTPRATPFGDQDTK